MDTTHPRPVGRSSILQTLPYLFFVALYSIAVLLLNGFVIRNIAAVAGLLSDSEDIIRVLGQLNAARISPPFYIPIGAGAMTGLMVLWYRTRPKALRLALVIAAGLVLAVLALALTVWISRVNSIPFGLFIRIIISLITNGALDAF